MAAPSRPRVLLVCSGLEHALRGFESFARDCFEALRDDPEIDLELIKGSGPAGERERAIPSMTRDNPVARALGRATGRDPFRFEQVAFGLALQPVLLRHDPDVVYFSEWHTGLVLAPLRRMTRRRFRTVLSNGTMAQANFGHLDYVQELTPAALAGNVAGGADPRRHFVLPYGFPIEPELEAVGPEDREALRRRFDLPLDRHIVVSVAALNNHHKRLDYLIEEVAQLPEPRPYLLLLGQPEPETPGIVALARERLGEDGHAVRSVPHAEVRAISQACDTFVLASLGEGLPRALVEGLGAGLPCLVHDYEVTRYALGDHGHYADFRGRGALAGLLRERLAAEDTPDAARARSRFAYDSFSWDRLRPRYVEMLHSVAQGAPVAV